VPGLSPLPKVCTLLNRHGAEYLIVGAQAAILHGYVRTTDNIDLLIPEDISNHQHVIDALAELEDHAAAELTPQDLINNVVVKIADEVEVDVGTHIGKIGYTDAIGSARHTEVEGVFIPFVDLPVLIESKQTYREQGRVDLQHLQSLLEKRDQK
jgi:hypothetical protein